MVNGKTLKIQDTGFDTPTGVLTHVKVEWGSDNWLPLGSDRINAEFTVTGTSNSGYKNESNVLGYFNNEVAAIMPPRWQINGLIPATETDLLRAIRNLQRTVGVKKLKGGLGSIAAMPDSIEDGDDRAIFVIVKNITFGEVVTNSTDYVAITMQLEQVK